MPVSSLSSSVPSRYLPRFSLATIVGTSCNLSGFLLSFLGVKTTGRVLSAGIIGFSKMSSSSLPITMVLSIILMFSALCSFISSSDLPCFFLLNFGKVIVLSDVFFDFDGVNSLMSSSSSPSSSTFFITASLSTVTSSMAERAIASKFFWASFNCCSACALISSAFLMISSIERLLSLIISPTYQVVVLRFRTSICLPQQMRSGCLLCRA